MPVRPASCLPPLRGDPRPDLPDADGDSLLSWAGAGGELSDGQFERVARAVPASWVARADLDIARPSREDVPVDEIVTPPDLAWAAPLQVKGVARDGLTVHQRYVGLPLLVCYVLLGRGDGALSTGRTRM